MIATTTPSLEALRLGAAQNGLHWFAAGTHLRVVPPAHPALQRTWLQMWQWLARSTQPRRVSRG